MNRRVAWIVACITLTTTAVLVAVLFRDDSTQVAAIRHKSISATDGKAHILFVGDTHFAEDYFARRPHWQARNVLERFGYEYPFAKLKALVQSADHVVANLETPLSMKAQGVQGFGSMKYLHWTEPDKALAVLSAHNLGAVNLANNHILDAGLPGLQETVDRLRQAGIAAFGAGMSESEASEPYLIDIDYGRHKRRVAVLGAYWYRKSYDEKHKLYAYGKSPGVRRLVTDNLVQQIKQLKKKDPAIFVIVFPQWGRNYKWKNTVQTEAAYALIEGGADLIIGHGAHQFQEVERYRDRWIIYNVGNFMFLTPGLYELHQAPPYGLAARVTLQDGIAGLEPQVRLYLLFSDNRRSNLQTYVLSGGIFREAMNLLRAASKQIQEQEITFVEGHDDVGAYIELRAGNYLYKNH
jgi:hypothetical protein